MESELKINFPSPEDLLAASEAAWFTDAIVLKDEKTEEYINSYFDTKEHVLLDKHVSLRVRQIVGKSFVHTVKLGAKSVNGFSQKFEWNQELPDGRFQIDRFLQMASGSEDPIEILKPVLLPIEDKDLVEICQTHFTRKTIPAEFKESLFEICLDNGACLAGGKSDPICEMEIELISGRFSDVIDFGHIVEKHSNGRFSDISKYGRCLALLQGENNV